MSQEKEESFTESQLQDERYNIMTRNAPLFYKSFLNHVLEWSAVTCQFLPEMKKSKQSEFIKQQILMGVECESKGSILISKVTLPNSYHKKYQGQKYQICEDKNSFLKPGINAIENQVEINHTESVYKARACINAYNLISSICKDGSIVIYDYTKHPFKPADDNIFPQMVLKGLSGGGWAMDWSTNGFKLLAGDNNGILCQWDLEKSEEIERRTGMASMKECISLNFLQKKQNNQKSINDVKHHLHQPEVFSYCSEGFIVFQDLRQNFDSQIFSIKTDKEIFSIDFDYFYEFLLGVSGENGLVQVFDIRNTKKHLQILQEEGENILGVRWNRNLSGILASGGEDSEIKFWDLSQKTKKLNFFSHKLNKGTISDFNWNPHIPLGMISVDTNNQVQIFEIKQKFLQNQQINQLIKNGI